MNTYFLGYIYAFLFIIGGWFLAVYVEVLMKPKGFTVDSALQYTGAALFIIIILGSVINWLRDCTVNVQAGLPTFGLEGSIKVIG